jgi:hypothetical protein
VLPSRFVRVPEEQILQAGRRAKRLYAGRPLDDRLTPTVQAALRASLDDLDTHPKELAELGMALFLDRPLGALKAAGEVDRTPMLSYRAFSRRIAGQRLMRVARWSWVAEGTAIDRLADKLAGIEFRGLPAAEWDRPQRPGVASLEDARLASPDFVYLSTTRGSLDELLDQYDDSAARRRFPEAFDWLRTSRRVLFVRRGLSGNEQPAVAAPPGQLALRAYDEQLRPRLEFACGDAGDAAPRTFWFGTTERLAGGLRLVCVWQPTPAGDWRACEVEGGGLRLPPRLVP